MPNEALMQTRTQTVNLCAEIASDYDANHIRDCTPVFNALVRHISRVRSDTDKTACQSLLRRWQTRLRAFACELLLVRARSASWSGSIPSQHAPASSPPSIPNMLPLAPRVRRSTRPDHRGACSGLRSA
eukprot:3512299-Rhodomonas_salina.2